MSNKELIKTHMKNLWKQIKELAAEYDGSELFKSQLNITVLMIQQELLKINFSDEASNARVSPLLFELSQMPDTIENNYIRSVLEELVFDGIAFCNATVIDSVLDLCKKHNIWVQTAKHPINEQLRYIRLGWVDSPK